jgi:hypothetical protein
MHVNQKEERRNPPRAAFLFDPPPRHGRLSERERGDQPSSFGEVMGFAFLIGSTQLLLPRNVTWVADSLLDLKSLFDLDHTSGSGCSMVKKDKGVVRRIRKEDGEGDQDDVDEEVGVIYERAANLFSPGLHHLVAFM